MAGVSAPTVSKVLNGRSGVAPETRRRVEAAAARARLPPAPGHVRDRQPGGRVLCDAEQPGASTIMHGVERVASEHRLGVGFTDVRSTGIERAVLGARTAGPPPDRRDRRTSGLHLRQQALLAASAIPLVGGSIPTGEPPLHAGRRRSRSTNWSGGIAADPAPARPRPSAHRRDHRPDRPAVRAGPAWTAPGRRWTPTGCRCPITWCAMASWFAFEDGLNHGRELLRLSPIRPPRYCAATTCRRWASTRRPGWPACASRDDLSVVGFDDLRPPVCCGPPMTTVRQPLVEMGAAAARELVLALAAGQPMVYHSRVELATTLGGAGPRRGRAATLSPGRPTKRGHRGSTS